LRHATAYDVKGAAPSSQSGGIGMAIIGFRARKDGRIRDRFGNKSDIDDDR
jgi:hypothetical protein